MIRAAAMVLCLATAPAAARDCPPPPDHGEERAQLTERLARAPDPGTAQRLMDRLWELWRDAPDAAAQDLLDRSISHRLGGQDEAALQLLDQLVAECPDYAEGWNQRAYMHYLRGDYAAALADIDATLERMPDHVGALSGRALALWELGRETEARRALDTALALNPWLPERSLIEAPGTDI
ncbi:tetratricopeptide repeat protein [Limimaricola variabilis]